MPDFYMDTFKRKRKRPENIIKISHKDCWCIYKRKLYGTFPVETLIFYCKNETIARKMLEKFKSVNIDNIYLKFNGRLHSDGMSYRTKS